MFLSLDVAFWFTLFRHCFSYVISYYYNPGIDKVKGILLSHCFDPITYCEDYKIKVNSVWRSKNQL